MKKSKKTRSKRFSKFVKSLLDKVKVDANNLIIYFIGFVISVLFIVLSFQFSHCNNWGTVLGGIGASGVGAVFLGFAIERANNCRLEKERLNVREKLISSFADNIIEIVCHEILILEKEDASFASISEGKSLDELLQNISEIYRKQVTLTRPSSANFDMFNSQNEEKFKIRHNVINKLGGWVNYTADDIYFNRSYNINNNLFTDTEIKVIKLTQFCINNLKNAEDYEMYLYYFEDLIDKVLYYVLDSVFPSLKIIKRTQEGFSNEKNRPVFISYESWIKEYEIQI